MAWQQIDNKGAAGVIYRVDTLNFLDTKRFQAEYGANLLFGKGIKFDSEDKRKKDLFKRLSRINKFDDLMQQTAQAANYYGRAIWTIDKTKSGDFMISLIGDDLFQNVMKVEITPFSAVLMRRKVIGINVFYITEFWTDKYVERAFQWWDDQNKTTFNLNANILQKLGFNGIPKELQIPSREIHNLGFIPIVEVPNKPNRNVLSSDTSQLADDANAVNMPLHINNGLREWYKSEILDKTRVHAYLTDDELKKLETRASTLGLALEDIIVRSARMGADNNKAVEVSPSSHDGMKYGEPLKVKIDLFMIACGYSPIFGSENEKTEAETLFSKDLDQRTTKTKRRRYLELLNELFRKIFVYKGLMNSVDDEEDFSIEINENMVYNRMQQIEFLNNAIATGLLSRKEAIAQMRDLDDLEQAQKIMKLIDQEAENDKFQAMPTDEEIAMQGNGGGIGKMRNGKDADPNNESESK